MAFIEYVYQDDAKVVEHKPLEVLEPGPAQFKITRVTDHTSKEGKHSTKLSVLVTRGDKRTFCDQYISERTGFKVKQIEEATPARKMPKGETSQSSIPMPLWA
jgi:hypothetical protein